MARRPVAVMEGTPRSSSRTVAANSVWQLLTFAARAISGLGVVVMVARSGGPRSLGVFQFAMTFTAMLPFYYGIQSLLAREVARRPGESRKWVEVGTLIALLAGALFTAVFVVGTRVVGASSQTAVALSIASVASRPSTRRPCTSACGRDSAASGATT